jgi:hypothetical protein
MTLSSHCSKHFALTAILLMCLSMMAQIPVSGAENIQSYTVERFDTQTKELDLYLDPSPSQVSFTLPANAQIVDAQMKVEGTLPQVVQRYTVASAPIAIKGADLDKDGDQDLAILSSRNDSVMVMFNDGKGHFDKTKAQEFMVTHDPQDMALADLDMDGKIDLAAVNGSDGAVTVRLSKTGLFGSMTNYLVGGNPNKVLVGDINNDTFPDIIVLRKEFPVVSILYNKGDGTFNPASDVSVNAAPSGAALLDVNHDGKLDIVVASSMRPYSLIFVKNTGAKTFDEADKFALEWPPSDLVAADLNRDGRTDLIAPSVQGNISVFMAQGSGFSNATTLRYTKQQSAFAGDLDNDGLMDLVSVSRWDSTVRTFTNKGGGGLSLDQLFMTGSNPAGVFLCDLDGDGSLDIATADNGGDTVSITMNHGDGKFAWFDMYDVIQSDKLVTLGDLDGDGLKDLVSTNYAWQSVTLAYNTGKGQFTIAQTYPGYMVYVGGSGGSEPFYPTIADYNGDGLNDIEYGEELSNAVIMMFNQGAGVFRNDSVAHELDKNLLQAPAYITLPVDVDGDKDLDIVTNHLNHDYISILLNDGTGHFDTLINHSMDGNHPFDIVAEDFNNDGIMDFVTANYGLLQDYEQNLSFIRNDGKGGLTNVYNLPVHKGPRSLAFTDMNGDGLRDIVVAFAPKLGLSDIVPGEVAVILAQKEPLHYKEPMYFRAGILPGVIHPAHLNDDGFPDIICLNQGTNAGGSFSIMMNKGDGTLTAPIDYPDISFRHVAFSDLNGDERDEVVVPVLGTHIAVYRALYYPGNFHMYGPAGDNLLQNPGLFQTSQDVNLTGSLKTFFEANGPGAIGNLTYHMNLTAGRAGMVRVSALIIHYKLPGPPAAREPKQFSAQGAGITLVLLGLLAFVALSVTTEKERAEPEPVRSKGSKPKGAQKSKVKRSEPGPVIVRKPAVQVQVQKKEWDHQKDVKAPKKGEATIVPKGPPVKVEVSKDDWRPSKKTVEQMKLDKATEHRDGIKVEKKYKKNGK